MMKSDPQYAAPDVSMDRKIIRVDIPPAHAGITAALRRAFEARHEPVHNDDFEDLLNKLN
jgi:hypothetical protein